MSVRRRAALAVSVCVAALSLSSAATAETLADAVALAYQSNPTLQSQRAQLRALDESYVQARQGFRPTIDSGATATYNNDDIGGESNGGSVSVTLSQPLYNGGRTVNGVRAVEADIQAARQDLREVEASVLLSTIQSYVDVVRDVERLRIREENVTVLLRQLEESRARFEVGEITRTDVAQAEARLANSQAELAQAQAQLAISRSSYAAVVGQNPGQLEPAPVLPGVPASVEEAFDVAQETSPAVLSSQLAEQASRTRVAQARADNRPSVALQSRLGYGGQLEPFDQRDFFRTFSVSAVVNQPIFAGGVRRSRVRAQLERNTADLIAVEGTRRAVVQNVSNSWQQLLASRASIASNEEQVRAARIAAEGVREEASVGLRTTLDVLNAETELRNAQLFLATSRRDEYVATASVLSAMGRLEARNLLPGTPLYDPAQNFERVRNNLAVPWEGIVETLDSIGGPKPAMRTDVSVDARAATRAPLDGAPMSTAP